MLGCPPAPPRLLGQRVRSAPEAKRTLPDSVISIPRVKQFGRGSGQIRRKRLTKAVGAPRIPFLIEAKRAAERLAGFCRTRRAAHCRRAARGGSHACEAPARPGVTLDPRPTAGAQRLLELRLATAQSLSRK